MNKSRKELISELTHDLPVASRTGQTMDLIVYWLVFNFVVALLLTWAMGPFRENSLQQAWNHPQFLLESLTGLIVIVVLSVTAFHSAIPSNISRAKQFTPALLLLLLWIGFYIFGLWSPALEPSNSGMRNSLCYLETMIYGIPSLLLGLYFINRFWPLHGTWSGLSIGLAAGATTALIMQFACMYVPAHIITHHLLPGLMLGLVGLVAGKFFLTR